MLALALGGLTYAVGAKLGAPGFLAVYIAGLIVGAQVPRHRRAIRSFHASLANTADIGLFLLLGLLVFPGELPAVALPALAVTAIILFVARPAAVAVCLTPFRIPWREQTVAAWAGLRGAVPIVLSTFPFAAGYPQGSAIFNVVFFVVLTSVLIQGSTVVLLVRRLGLETPRPAWETVAEALPLEGVEADLVEVTVTDELFLAGRTLPRRRHRRACSSRPSSGAAEPSSRTGTPASTPETWPSSPHAVTRKPSATSPPGHAARSMTSAAVDGRPTVDVGVAGATAPVLALLALTCCLPRL